MLNKEHLKSATFGFEVRSTAIISNGLVHRVPKQQTLKLMRKELVRLQKYANLSQSETNRLWQENYSRYIRVSKQSFSSLRRANSAEKGTIDYENELKLRKNIVYKTVRNEFPLMEKNKNELVNAVEYRAKRDQLTDLFASGVFYLCSSHTKPAKDHADWEGKIYVSDDWRNRVDQDLHGKIEAYIKNHDVKTVEWVTGEPVYLVTRPNCKHYLIEVGVEEVLGNSAKSLLKAHKMYMQDEVTISYEYAQYKGYYERLKMLTYLHRMFDAEEMNKDIQDTRRLARKWLTRAKTVEV